LANHLLVRTGSGGVEELHSVNNGIVDTCMFPFCFHLIGDAIRKERRTNVKKFRFGPLLTTIVTIWVVNQTVKTYVGPQTTEIEMSTNHKPLSLDDGPI
jgi:hypothetical protein